MTLEHNSQETFFRMPFGAVTCKTDVTLRLAASGFGLPHYVRLVVLKDGGNEVFYDMNYVMSILNASIYEVTLTVPKTECLLWYYFELKNENGIFYYANNESCLGGMGEMYQKKPDKKFQITVYREDFKTPEWLSN